MKLRLRASKADIASYLGLRPETFTRRLAEMAQLGVIRVLTRHCLEILDFAGLTREAGLYGGVSG